MAESEAPGGRTLIEMPMFPLGSVLFPSMPLVLRVFEERYLAMLAHVLAEEPSEFGVVLIERGQEVGGGEHLFDIGTIALLVTVTGVVGALAIWRLALAVGANFLFARPDAFWIAPRKKSAALQPAE